MEAESDIKEDDYKHVMDEEAVLHIDEVIAQVELPYSLAPFQRTAIAVLASGHDVVLVQATGSGKMTIPLIVAKMRRRSVPRGVAIVTQPLTGLMMEKLNNKICRSALISMSGHIVVANISAESTEDAKLSCSVEELLNTGDIEVLFGHPEHSGFGPSDWPIWTDFVGGNFRQRVFFFVKSYKEYKKLFWIRNYPKNSSSITCYPEALIWP